MPSCPFLLPHPTNQVAPRWSFTFDPRVLILKPILIPLWPVSLCTAVVVWETQKIWEGRMDRRQVSKEVLVLDRPSMASWALATAVL